MTPIWMRILVICLACCLGCSSATVSSTTIRGSSSKNEEMQVEDYIVMQMEMAWGLKEMGRYRSHRGDWPTRSASSSYDDEQDEEEDQLNRQQQQEPIIGNQNEGDTSDASESSSSTKLRGNNNSNNETTNDETSPLLGEIDDEMALILNAKKATRRVEDYWDSLVTMF